MKIICLDFESYYDQTYSLDRMTTEAYVRDPRFEVHGAAIKWNAKTLPQWYDARQLEWQLQNNVDWDNVGVICHHAHFDGLVLNHVFGARPKFWFCTLSMARLLIGNHLPLGLDAVAKHFALPPKSMPYNLFKGKHWHELNAWEQSAVAEGCKHDVQLTWDIFERLSKSFPSEEYGVVDMTVRMFTEPKLEADLKLLGDIWYEERDRRQALWQKLNIDPKVLRSNEQFAALLESKGVEVQYKNGKNGPIPAVAKNDSFIQELLEDEDEELAELAQARVDSKSSIIQTRAATIGDMATRGALCIYLFYCGAGTTRWSGGDGTNFQNLRRRHRIRSSLMASTGYLLAIPDQSQIECRLLNFLAGQHDVVEKFRNGEDPYIGIASQFYGRAITKADEAERGTGKQAELSCGYCCGWLKFQRTARAGLYGPPVVLSDADSQRAVYLYRDTHRAVTQYWKQGDGVLGALANGQAGTWGPMSFHDGKIYLPNGCPLNYDTLEYHVNQETGEQGFRRKTRNGWERMYGGKLVEQTTQALARVTASQAMLRIRNAGFSVVGTSHDEAWVLIPDDAHKDEAAEHCRREMMRVPSWLPGIPLDADVKVDRRYAK